VSIVKDVIYECYRLGEAAETIWHLDGGYARRKAVITCRTQQQQQNQTKRADVLDSATHLYVKGFSCFRILATPSRLPVVTLTYYRLEENQ
jgi:hypothetical protein